MSANKLNFQDVVMVCNQMVTEKRSDVESALCGKAVLPMLEAYIKKAENLFPGVSKGVPFAEQLSEEDTYHDAVGQAVLFVCDAYLAHPDVSPGMKDIVRMVITTFVSGAAELQGTYVNEAANALQRKMLLPAHEAKLKMIPVTLSGDAASQASLFDWISSFLDSGERIGQWLSKRSDQSARVHAGLLRAEMLGTLGAFRGSLEREVRVLGALPEDIVGRVFGYMDMLCEARAGGSKGKADAPEGGGEAGTP